MFWQGGGGQKGGTPSVSGLGEEGTTTAVVKATARE